MRIAASPQPVQFAVMSTAFLARLRQTASALLIRLRHALVHRRERALRTRIVNEMAALRESLIAAGASPGVLIHDYYARLLDRIGEVYALRNLDYNSPLGRSQERALALLRAFAVMRCTGAPKARFGRIGDGGYVHLDDFAEMNAAISLGIANEVSWDLAMAARGLDIYQFDNAIDRPPVAAPKFHFTRATVGRKGLSLARMIADTGVDPARTILKIDIEGAEWDLLADAPDDLLACFPQIICEFHALGSDDFFLNFVARMAVLDRLNAHHRVVHIHGNNCSGVRLIGSLAIPDVLEVTYANRTRYEFEPSDETFPTELDKPNEPTVSEILLGKLRY